MTTLIVAGAETSYHYVAVAGLVVATFTLVWQVLAFLASRGWVTVEAHPVVALREVDDGPWESEGVLKVVVRNRGGTAIQIDAWGIHDDKEVYMGLPGGPGRGSANLELTVAPNHAATFESPARSLLDAYGAGARVKAFVELGTGRTKKTRGWATLSWPPTDK